MVSLCGTYEYGYVRPIDRGEIRSKPSSFPPSYVFTQHGCEWQMSVSFERLTGCRAIVDPSCAVPDVTVSAPGKPLNRLSTVRFSWMMMTTCLMGSGDGVGEPAAPATAGPDDRNSAEIPIASNAKYVMAPRVSLLIEASSPTEARYFFLAAAFLPEPAAAATGTGAGSGARCTTTIMITPSTNIASVRYCAPVSPNHTMPGSR